MWSLIIALITSSGNDPRGSLPKGNDKGRRDEVVDDGIAVDFEERYQISSPSPSPHLLSSPTACGLSILVLAIR